MTRRLFFLLLIVSALALPFLARASAVPLCVPTGDTGQILPPCVECGDCKLTDFLDLFINLFKFGLQIVLPLAILYFVVGGIILITAAGYSNRIEMGKNIVKQAVTGLIIVLISWFIVDGAMMLITGDARRTVFGKPWYAGFTYRCDTVLDSPSCTGDKVTQVKAGLMDLDYGPFGGGNQYDNEVAAAVLKFQQDVDGVVDGGASGCSLAVWNVVMNKSCTPPPPVCSPSTTSTPCCATTSEMDAQRLAQNRVADEKTQEMIVRLAGAGPTVINEFVTRCKS